MKVKSREPNAVGSNVDDSKDGVILGSKLLETSNAIIVGLDPKGKIILFNSGAQRFLEYEKKEVMNTPWFHYLMDDCADNGVLQILQWDIGSGLKTRYENRVRSGSGRILHISWENTAIYDEIEGISMILMVGQDITQTKKYAQSLRDHGRELSKALNEISIYNDLMLHDIKNIDAAIMGYLQLMSLDDIDPETREKYRKKALCELRKGIRITNDVGIMARAQSEPSQISTDLSDVLANVINRIDEEACGDSIEISYEDSDLSVLADDLLEEAILQLIEQISQRVQGRVKVEIKVKRDPSLEKSVVDPVHIALEENGGFIYPEEAENLFGQEPRPNEVSNMLGFYLIKKIIDRYQGKLWVESPEKGKTVTHIVLSESI